MVERCYIVNDLTQRTVYLCKKGTVGIFLNIDGQPIMPTKITARVMYIRRFE